VKHPPDSLVAYAYLTMQQLKDDLKARRITFGSRLAKCKLIKLLEDDDKKVKVKNIPPKTKLVNSKSVSSTKAKPSEVVVDSDDDDDDDDGDDDAADDDDDQSEESSDESLKERKKQIKTNLKSKVMTSSELNKRKHHDDGLIFNNQKSEIIDKRKVISNESNESTGNMMSKV
jgi:hypothetical protein